MWKIKSKKLPVTENRTNFVGVISGVIPLCLLPSSSIPILSTQISSTFILSTHGVYKVGSRSSGNKMLNPDI